MRSSSEILPIESLAVDVRELLDSQRFPAGEVLNHVIGSGKDPVLVVLSYRNDVLHDARDASILLHSFAKLWNGDRLVHKRPPQLRWHRDGFRRYWRGNRAHGEGARKSRQSCAR